MKNIRLTLLATIVWMLFVTINQAFGQTCTTEVEGTKTLSSLIWYSEDGGTCPPMSPYTGDIVINGPGNLDTIIIDVNFEMTGTLTMNGLGNPTVRINEGITLTVNGDIFCMHPNSTIDVYGTLNVAGTMQLKNNCFFCGPGVININDILIKNNGSCDEFIELNAVTCEAKNNDFCVDCIDGVLAVEMVEFSGKALDDGISLQWLVEEQGENAFYSLERSEDAVESWNYVAEIPNVTGKGQYTYFDPSPDIGVNYYKLSQTDIDGSTAMLAMIAVEHKRPGTMKVWSNGMNLTVQSFEPTGIHEITISDLSGRIHNVESLLIGEGEETHLSLDQLSSGFYVIVIEYKGGFHAGKVILTDGT